MAVQSILMVQYYFDKKRPFATGISSVGHSMGTVTMLPLVSVLNLYFGIRGALVLHAGITMQNIVLASLFRPIDVKAKDKKYQERYVTEEKSGYESTQENNGTEDGRGRIYVKKRDESRFHRVLNNCRSMLKLWDFSLFKERVFVQFLLALVLQEFGIAVMYRFTSVKAVADGVTTIEASLLPPITGKYISTLSTV